MKIKKEELLFLAWYNIVASQKKEVYKSLHIKVKDQTARFTMYTLDMVLFTDVSVDSLENFELVYDITMFSTFLNKLPEGTLVDITEEGVQFGNNEYRLYESEDIQIPDPDNYLTALNKQKPESQFIVTDLSLLKSAKNFMGEYDVNQNLELIALQKEKFVTTNLLTISMIHTKNDESINMYFSSNLIALIDKLSINELHISKYSDFLKFTIGSTTFIIIDNNYNYPDLLEQEYQNIYNVPYKGGFNKLDLKESFSRMQIVAMNSPQQRVYITFITDGITIENRDSRYCKEIVHGEVDPELIGFTACVPCDRIIKIISHLPGKTVNIHSDKDIESVIALRFDDERDDKFYISVVFEHEENIEDIEYARE